MPDQTESSLDAALRRSELQAKLMELEQQIARMDAEGKTGPELDEMHARYETLQEELRGTDHQDLQAAA